MWFAVLLVGGESVGVDGEVLGSVDVSVLGGDGEELGSQDMLTGEGDGWRSWLQSIVVSGGGECVWHDVVVVVGFGVGLMGWSSGE